MRLKDARVTVVGLGLMGGSLAAALRAGDACREVRGVARRLETIAEALARGFVDGGTLDLAEGVRGADVVVLATPVRTIVELIPRLGPLLSPDCLLMDVGSTKAAIVAAMERLPGHVQPLGGHPMCGKEVSGIGAAEADLYRGATFVLTPLPRTSPEALALAWELVEAVGARPLVMDAHRHDRLVAAVSHLPYLLSLALVAAAEDVAEEDGMVWDLAASGFRDASRLAASDVTMMLDILLTNREEVAGMLARFREALDELARLLEAEDERGLRRMMEAARRRRKGLFQ
ncbi:MAG TPA: prephenate dehydrogenase [Anaerolineae bacterium]|nr:prephenate dehydrogenase [Anaerolineae bacterium]